MGFLSSITDTLFGDDGKAAADKQSKENRKSREFLAEQTEKARDEIFPLFGAAEESRRAGSQAALDVLGGALPAQLGAFQGGNVGAQQALLTGLPQVQNAILGLPTDLSGLQPQQLNIDTSFIPTQLPGLPTQQQALRPTTPGGMLEGATTNADLLRLVSQGSLGLEGVDNKFFGDLLKQSSPATLASNSFLNVAPENQANFIQGTGFNTKNKARLSNLLTALQGVR